MKVDLEGVEEVDESGLEDDAEGVGKDAQQVKMFEAK
jgi:hypothetical protein